MLHSTSLIATLVAAFGLALLFGVLANRLRLSPLVGYLVAGVLIGPSTPGFVANQGLAAQLILVHQPGPVLATFLIVVAGNAIVAAGIILALGYPLRKALTIGAALSQIGEFSFILAGSGSTSNCCRRRDAT